MSKKVLVVDDDLDSREICRAVLCHAGYEVIQADDGRGVLNLIRQHRPDALILDLALPRQSGLDIARRIRTDREASTLPMLAYTANAIASARDEALRAGFQAYLTKPCDPHQVVEAIHRLIGPPQQEEPPTDPSST